MALAVHFTPAGRYTTTTVETVRFERPPRVSFRLLRGPVPHVTDTYGLGRAAGGTAFVDTGELGIDLWRLGEWWGARRRALGTRRGRVVGLDHGGGRTPRATPLTRPGGHRAGPAAPAPVRRDRCSIAGASSAACRRHDDARHSGRRGEPSALAARPARPRLAHPRALPAPRPGVGPRSQGTHAVPQDAETCQRLRPDAGTGFLLVRRDVGSRRSIRRHGRTSMVRKGSPVRVRQRALRSPPQTVGFVVQEPLGSGPRGPPWKRLEAVARERGCARRVPAMRPPHPIAAQACSGDRRTRPRAGCRARHRESRGACVRARALRRFARGGRDGGRPRAARYGGSRRRGGPGRHRSRGRACRGTRRCAQAHRCP